MKKTPKMPFFIDSVVEEHVDGFMIYDLDEYYGCLNDENFIFEPA